MTGMGEGGLLGAVLALLPEALLVLGGVGCLLLASWTPRRRLRRVSWAATAVVAASATATVAQLAGLPAVSADPVMGTVAIDPLSASVRLAVAGSLLVLLAIARHEAPEDARAGEVAVLLLLGGAGAQLLGLTTDLAVLVLAFLLASIPLYGLLALLEPSPATGQADRAGRAAEATVKTYLLGALTGVLLMLGCALLAGAGGGTTYDRLAAGSLPAAAATGGLLLVLTGLLFKAGAPPAHAWLPDAVAGTSVTAGAFATTVPKLGAVLAVGRLGESLAGSLAVAVVLGAVAVLAMLWGNLAALTQRDVRRLLAWSTIGQTGFLLAGAAALATSERDTAVQALAVFLPAYAAANLTCFVVLLAQPARGTLAAWRGAGRTQPVVVAGLAVGLLALVGTPPAGVLVGKALVLAATWPSLGVVAVVLAATTVVSLGYYLRWLATCLASADAGHQTGTDHDADHETGTDLDTDHGTETSTARVRPLLAATATTAVALGLLAGPALALLALAA